MLYTEYMHSAKKATIVQADNGLFYLEPEWRLILADCGMGNLSDISDIETDWADVKEVLHLEVEKLNTINSVRPQVEAWLYDVITAQVEPAVLEEETNYLKNLTEYLRESHKE